MKKLFFLIFILGLLFGEVASAEKKEFRDWLNSFGLSKPIVQDKVYYMGISYDGKKIN